MGVCTAEHTKFQPTKEEWLCPKCGADNKNFVIEQGAEGTDEDCVLLHKDDEVICMICGCGWSGNAVSKLMEKKVKEGEYIPCPHCQGRGRIKKG